MLLDYLETAIVRKVKLIYLLFYADQKSIDYLALQLDCTPVTLLEDVIYLQEQLDVALEISTQNDIDYVTLKKDHTTFRELLNRIYETSYFLKFLAHFFNPAGGKYAQFIASHHLSTATGYRLRKSVIAFLKPLQLSLKNNVISGNSILIRFLAVELQSNFGVHMIDINPEIQKRCEVLLGRVEELIQVRFSLQEKQMFILLIQSSIDNAFPHDGEFLSKYQLDSVQSNITPPQFKTWAQELFADYWQERCLDELDFATLALIVVNSHIFEATASNKQLEHSRQAFIENPEIKRLVTAISQKFTINPRLSDHFYTSLYLFLRDSSFDMQPITLGNYIYLQEPKTVIYQQLKKILHAWNIYGINFNKYHIYALYNRIAPALSVVLYDNIIIVSDKNIDAKFLKKYIRVLVGEQITITIESQINRQDERLSDERSIYIIDKNSDIALPLDLISNCFYTSFPMGNSQTYQLLDQLNLLY